MNQEKKQKRCAWSGHDPLYIAYHDEEVTVYPPRPLAGEGPGVRAVVPTTYPLTLALTQ